MLVAANWKAYVGTKERAKKLFTLAKGLSSRTGVDIVLCVPAPYIGMLAPGNRSKVGIGAQDISTATGGAKTGEIIGPLLSELGASYVIVGHSERRAMGENDLLVLDKTKRALANGLTPILCVGESIRDPDAKYLQFLRSQIAEIYAPLSPKERSQIVIAYEPIWAIGKTAEDAITPHDLTEMVLYIRKVLGEYPMSRAVARIPVLYGGSIEPENARMLAAGTRVDGFLVGHASVEPESFSALVKSLAA